MKTFMIVFVMMSMNFAQAGDLMLERKKQMANRLIDKIASVVDQSRQCVSDAETKVELKTCQRDLKLKVKELKKLREKRKTRREG